MNKILKIVVIMAIVVAILWGAIFLTKYLNSGESREDIWGVADTVLTLDDKLSDDAIWCGTFQLIWNDLKNELAKQDIVFTPQLEVVENLNRETFTTADISEHSYYKKLGYPSLELKREIEKAIKDKFNETSDILDNFDWGNRTPGDYFLYAMLKKEFQFEKEFEELERGRFGSQYDNVEYFGIKSDAPYELRKQVEVLYYKSKEDFAIKLKTKQEDEVILCMGGTRDTFNETYKNIVEEEKKYDGAQIIQEGELLKIPTIEVETKQEFTELENKPFFFSNGAPYRIEKALQTIEFELDKSGGRIKSEAGMMADNFSAALFPEEKREFLIDDMFMIFLIEEGKSVPYFAAKINNIHKFQD